jgi:hypothetical protein
MKNRNLGVTKSTSQWLQASLNDYLVLAEPLSGCIGLLNPVAAWVVEAKTADLTNTEIASSLATRFDIDIQSAEKEVDGILKMYAKLIQQARNPQPRQKKPSPDKTRPILFHPVHSLQLSLGLQIVRLEVESTALFESLNPCIRHLHSDNPQHDQQLQLRGSEDYWQIVLNNQVLVDGTGRDGAVSHTIGELVELGCESDNRQMVVHGAGICRNGHGALLIGKGGSGKTTLAAALNASGFDLINDDVIAVSRNGQLASACMSMCLKPGSWPLLPCHLPEI